MPFMASQPLQGWRQVFGLSRGCGVNVPSTERTFLVMTADARIEVSCSGLLELPSSARVSWGAMARIGICHFRVGELDGVSLEIDKSLRVLQRMGHETFLCAGQSGSSADPFIIPELALEHPDVVRIRRSAFRRLADYPSEAALLDHLERMARRIEAQLLEFVDRSSLDLLIVHNLLALPINLAATVGVQRGIQASGLPVLAHHHDFLWERDEYSNPTCEVVRRLLAGHFPPKGPNLTHIVINRLAQEELARRGVASVIVPNVFDFGMTAKTEPLRFREQMGLAPADVVFLQATRVVRRKGIEIAVDLVARLGSSDFQSALDQRVRTRGCTARARPVLLLPNMVEDPEYCAILQERAARMGVDARFVSGQVSFEQSQARFNLWDTYMHADFATYPSLLEGWGNQLLEAIWAKLPVALYEYPVFRTDIAPVGFKYVSLGHSHETDDMGLVRIPRPVLDQAAQEVAELLATPDRYSDIAEHNFTLGRTHFSLESLAEYLDRLVSAALGGSADDHRLGEPDPGGSIADV